MSDLTGAATPPYTLAEAELFFEMFGHWPQSRVPVERYLDPGFARMLSDEIGAAVARSVPEGSPLLPLVAAMVTAGTTERKRTTALAAPARSQRR